MMLYLRILRTYWSLTLPYSNQLLLSHCFLITTSNAKWVIMECKLSPVCPPLNLYEYQVISSLKSQLKYHLIKGHDDYHYTDLMAKSFLCGHYMLYSTFGQESLDSGTLYVTLYNFLNLSYYFGITADIYCWISDIQYIKVFTSLSLLNVNNYIVRSYIDVIVVTNIITRRTS